MGTITTSSETAFEQPAESIYDFVTDPRNWAKTYPGSAHIEGVEHIPLAIGDIWTEGGTDPNAGRATWRLITAVRPTHFTFQSVGLLPTKDRDVGFEGVMTISYRFSSPGADVTVFHRTMSLDVPKHSALPPGVITFFDPSYIDAYHQAVAKAISETRNPFSDVSPHG